MMRLNILFCAFLYGIAPGVCKYNLINTSPTCASKGLCPYATPGSFDAIHPNKEERLDLVRRNMARVYPDDFVDGKYGDFEVGSSEYYNPDDWDYSKTKTDDHPYCNVATSIPYYYHEEATEAARFERYAHTHCDTAWGSSYDPHSTCPQFCDLFGGDCYWYTRVNTFLNDGDRTSSEGIWGGINGGYGSYKHCSDMFNPNNHYLGIGFWETGDGDVQGATAKTYVYISSDLKDDYPLIAGAHYDEQAVLYPHRWIDDKHLVFIVEYYGVEIGNIKANNVYVLYDGEAVEMELKMGTSLSGFYEAQFELPTECKPYGFAVLTENNKWYRLPEDESYLFGVMWMDNVYSNCNVPSGLYNLPNDCRENHYYYNGDLWRADASPDNDGNSNSGCIGCGEAPTLASIYKDMISYKYTYPAPEEVTTARFIPVNILWPSGKTRGLNYEWARIYCEHAYGTELATVDSDEAFEALKDVVDYNTLYYIGVNELETDGQWVFDDGADCGGNCIDQSYWKDGRPADLWGSSTNTKLNCGIIKKGEIDNYWCHTWNGFVCNGPTPSDSISVTTTTTAKPTTTTTTTQDSNATPTSDDPEYIVISHTQMSWNTANAYCQNHFASELATYDLNSINKLKEAASTGDDKMWFSYLGNCYTIDISGNMESESCDSELSFICNPSNKNGCVVIDDMSDDFNGVWQFEGSIYNSKNVYYKDGYYLYRVYSSWNKYYYWTISATKSSDTNDYGSCTATDIFDCGGRWNSANGDGAFSRCALDCSYDHDCIQMSGFNEDDYGHVFDGTWSIVGCDEGRPYYTNPAISDRYLCPKSSKYWQIGSYPCSGLKAYCYKSDIMDCNNYFKIKSGGSYTMQTNTVSSGCSESAFVYENCGVDHEYNDKICMTANDIIDTKSKIEFEAYSCDDEPLYRYIAMYNRSDVVGEMEDADIVVYEETVTYYLHWNGAQWSITENELDDSEYYLLAFCDKEDLMECVEYAWNIKIESRSDSSVDIGKNDTEYYSIEYIAKYAVSEGMTVYNDECNPSDTDEVKENKNRKMVTVILLLVFLVGIILVGIGIFCYVVSVSTRKKIGQRLEVKDEEVEEDEVGVEAMQITSH